ncbi:MAG TPA: hypothetical protein VFY29_12940 [Terriglobia bacterium]|nr:hypothetical protein [Terriglobia bacterium]
MFLRLSTSKRLRREWSRFALYMAIGAFTLPPLATPVGAQGSLDRFTGAWIGAQNWKTDTPSPYAREGQNVSVLIGNVGNELGGTMTPFLGFAEGVRFTDVRISGNQLRATGVIRPPQSPPNPDEWKDSVLATFVFTIDKGELVGTANLTMGNVPWLRLEYRLRRP